MKIFADLTFATVVGLPITLQTVLPCALDTSCWNQTETYNAFFTCSDWGLALFTIQILALHALAVHKLKTSLTAQTWTSGRKSIASGLVTFDADTSTQRIKQRLLEVTLGTLRSWRWHFFAWVYVLFTGVILQVVTGCQILW